MAKNTRHGMMITAELARAAGTDAGNRHMSAHTLKPWNREAFNVAVRTSNRLLLNVHHTEGGLGDLNLTVEQWEELGIEARDLKRAGHVSAQADRLD